MRADGIEENIMPKKDTASAVLGMLSIAGAQTRKPLEDLMPAVDAAPATETIAVPTVTVTEEVQASVSPFRTAQQATTVTAPEAPRTLRLRSTTAQRLREAWLEAKRDDVLLTAQDFASDLVEEALRRRRRVSASTS
jgi:hypothetical protein